MKIGTAPFASALSKLPDSTHQPVCTFVKDVHNFIHQWAEFISISPRSCCIYQDSYPGLLTPAFVACSTNTGEGLVKLITCNDVPGRVEEWHIPGKTASKQVHYQLQTRTIERLSSQHQIVLATFLGFSHFTAVQKECATPGMSLHVIQFCQAFPHVSTASDKCWGEKAWVRG